MGLVTSVAKLLLWICVRLACYNCDVKNKPFITLSSKPQQKINKNKPILKVQTK